MKVALRLLSEAVDAGMTAPPFVAFWRAVNATIITSIGIEALKCAFELERPSWVSDPESWWAA